MIMRHPVSFYVALLVSLMERVRSKAERKEVAEEFFAFIEKANDTKMLRKVLTRFLVTERSRHNVASVVVTGTAEKSVTAALKEQIKSALKHDFEDVTFETKVNPDLGGGVRIVVDKSYAVDATSKDLSMSLFRKSEGPKTESS